MTTVINEAFIGSLDENCYLMGEGMTLLIMGNVNLLRRIFLMGKMDKFLAVGLYSPPSPGFPTKV